MLKSMTGFGRGVYSDEEVKFVVEIKTVNHRYNDIFIKMPKTLNQLEDKIRTTITSKIHRGRVDISISMDLFNNSNKKVNVDKKLAIAYDNVLRELAVALEIPYTTALLEIAKQPDVLVITEDEADITIFTDKLNLALTAAVENILQMRTIEGQNIKNDLLSRVCKLEELVSTIKVQEPIITNDYRDKLLVKVKEFINDSNVVVDEGRLLQEVALFADRINFTEELVRLSSHFIQFKTNLEVSEPIGRKLDFIVQEINRETNTIASKANDFTVANIIVELKSEIEKIREQIQNVE
ncbi:MAG: YicC family protein [Negativicutes bacterium]|nr:YicC family protein [Negativicutes bacterium]